MQMRHTYQGYLSLARLVAQHLTGLNLFRLSHHHPLGLACKMRKRDEYVAFCLDETEDESVCSYYFLKLPMRLVQQPFCALRPRLRPSNECAPGVCVGGGGHVHVGARTCVCWVSP